MSWYPRKSVVVPIDFSASSPEAVQTAIDLVDDRANVRVLHVLIPLEIVSPGMAFGGMTDNGREEHALKYAEQYMQEHGFEGVDFEVRIGHPGEVVAQYSEARDADLIVIPSHGYHGLKRFVLGSVAEYVIEHADCPVLVLRRTDAE
ncbi:MAG: universal stress protein [Maioricimonas sp. JB049]